MSPLAIASLLLGLFAIVSRLPGVLAPAPFRARLLQFPRAVWPGRVVMLVVAVWAGSELFGAARMAAAEAARGPGGAGFWQIAPPAVVVGVPVAYWLIIQYGDQFLSLRSVAALVLLICNVVVRAADRHESPWRLVVTALAYVWIVAAIWMAAAPHHFRDLLGICLATDRRCRLVCSVGVGIGLGLVGLGLFVY